MNNQDLISFILEAIQEKADDEGVEIEVSTFSDEGVLSGNLGIVLRTESDDNRQLELLGSS